MSSFKFSNKHNLVPSRTDMDAIDFAVNFASDRIYVLSAGVVREVMAGVDNSSFTSLRFARSNGALWVPTVQTFNDLNATIAINMVSKRVYELVEGVVVQLTALTEYNGVTLIDDHIDASDPHRQYNKVPRTFIDTAQMYASGEVVRVGGLAIVGTDTYRLKQYPASNPVNWLKNGIIVNCTETELTILTPDGVQKTLVFGGGAGEDGLSAYEVALANGFVGTESQWLASLVGATGATGPQGTIGPQGPQGVAGPAGGALVKYASFTTAADLFTTSVIPLDDTIPEITEGAGYIEFEYIPALATSILEIEFTTNVSSSISSRSIIAIFEDNTTDAIAAVITSPTSSVNITPAQLRCVIGSGSTNSRIYKIRVGTTSGTAQTQINRRPTENSLGNSLLSVLTIKEFI